MKTPKFYPEFTPNLFTTLNTWKKLIQDDPTYLEDEDCPYEPNEIEFLALLFSPNSNDGMTVAAQEIEDLDSIPDFETEALQLYRDMKSFKTALNKSDTSEMTSTFRTMVSLMEKILDVQERASGIKQFGVFKTFILDSMERYLTPQQKSEFIDEMKLVLNQE
ncbi:hypothetical protein KUL118_01590 [Tenacibaculum sp. KUL118]|nr:hypothetical protein KUL118_01590 [Tenacibaculum sp. KUL118]